MLVRLKPESGCLWSSTFSYSKRCKRSYLTEIQMKIFVKDQKKQEGALDAPDTPTVSPVFPPHDYVRRCNQMENESHLGECAPVL